MARILLPVLALFWAGLLFGVAYLATPAVFSAETVTRTVGIDATRHSFTVLNRAEIVLALASLLALSRAAAGRWVKGCIVLAVVIVALETFWMLPTLDARSDMVVSGTEPPPSAIHTLYISADTLKLLALLAAGGLAAKSLREDPKEKTS